MHDSLVSQRDAALAEVERLRAWKQSALTILDGWDDVFGALPVEVLEAPANLGQSKAAVALAYIVRTREAEAEAARLRLMVGRENEMALASSEARGALADAEKRWADHQELCVMANLDREHLEARAELAEAAVARVEALIADPPGGARVAVAAWAIRAAIDGRATDASRQLKYALRGDAT